MIQFIKRYWKKKIGILLNKILFKGEERYFLSLHLFDSIEARFISADNVAINIKFGRKARTKRRKKKRCAHLQNAMRKNGKLHIFVGSNGFVYDDISCNEIRFFLCMGGDADRYNSFMYYSCIKFVSPILFFRLDSIFRWCTFCAAKVKTETAATTTTVQLRYCSLVWWLVNLFFFFENGTLNNSHQFVFDANASKCPFYFEINI